MFSFAGVFDLVKELKEEAKAAKVANMKETTAPPSDEPGPEAGPSTEHEGPTSEELLTTCGTYLPWVKKPPSSKKQWVRINLFGQLQMQVGISRYHF